MLSMPVCASLLSKTKLNLPTYSNPLNVLVPIVNSQKLYGLLRPPEESKPNLESRTPL